MRNFLLNILAGTLGAMSGIFLIGGVAVLSRGGRANGCA